MGNPVRMFEFSYPSPTTFTVYTPLMPVPRTNVLYLPSPKSDLIIIFFCFKFVYIRLLYFIKLLYVIAGSDYAEEMPVSKT